MGLFGNIAVGLIGSALGFWGGEKIGIQADSTLARWVWRSAAPSC